MTTLQHITVLAAERRHIWWRLLTLATNSSASTSSSAYQPNASSALPLNEDLKTVLNAYQDQVSSDEHRKGWAFGTIFPGDRAFVTMGRVQGRVLGETVARVTWDRPGLFTASLY
eukprot:CAMPEP_0206144876 /NCGR_PEP_ID=MMETSP1473-20131121/25732_1 /ASSEMBLY_ACC=CAM_ASM_001109 /TAXON_ID=1461547 /ORGANISM="Stichococcus sp, Strain RCC1054" /LENGTH=114 /DNA_ID=CAMNT_0053540875 /DNA_START=322 /DNA_END=666 /DNA_ORIENTATION=+